MRDPRRIDGLYKRLAALHKMVPDMRLSQFLINIFNEFGEDPFYMEDEEFLSKVEQKVVEWFHKKEKQL